MDIQQLLVDIRSKTIDVSQRLSAPDINSHKAQFFREHKGDSVIDLAICNYSSECRRVANSDLDETRQILEAAENLLHLHYRPMCNACLTALVNEGWEFDTQLTLDECCRNGAIRINEYMRYVRDYLYRCDVVVDGITTALPDVVEFKLYVAVMIEVTSEQKKTYSLPKATIEYQLPNGSKCTHDLF